VEEDKTLHFILKINKNWWKSGSSHSEYGTQFAA
jgi:hypothetical protein